MNGYPFSDRNHSRRRSSNKVEDIAIANAESYMRVRGRRTAIEIQYEWIQFLFSLTQTFQTCPIKI